ncbi:hypothetical protein R3P38DRAFT_3212834 [Favolaschia claudopus]|uniref:Uncharacterized protein n=1 Tax=Favolaschia claudopus TaxID=2862362 RepID=A0AAW0AD51_9AGAR
MTRPADLDAASLTSASGAQLNYWIDAVNKDLPKKVLVKTGTVDIRRQRLADYFSIDLSSLPPAPSIGPISRDTEINKRQWDHLRSLGAEWAEKDKSGQEFQLVSETLSNPSPQTLLPSIKSAIQQTLATAANPMSSVAGSHQMAQPMDVETVQALIKSAGDGDIQALATLFNLQVALTVHSGAAPANLGTIGSSSIPSASVSGPSTTTAPSKTYPSPALANSGTSLSSSSDSAILLSGNLTIEALKKAEGLRDVISQVENGEVARIRELYGPQEGRDANPLWQTLKITVNRRERLANELRNEFNGDKDRFFTFFTVAQDSQNALKKRKKSQPAEKLRPLRLVVEAIVHRDRALEIEKQSAEYQSNGVFVAELWEGKWAGKNKWEIWRAIGKEDYSRK